MLRRSSLLGPAVGFLALSGACTEPEPEETVPSTTTTPTTTAPRDLCGAEDLVWAQPVVDVDGLHAVPIDVQTLQATVLLDTALALAEAEATLTFQLGPDGGHPLLDLRQDPEWLELDGVPLDPADFAIHTVTEEPDSEVRVIAVDLEPCSTHTLAAGYPLALPRAPNAKAVTWGPEADVVRWDLWSSDLYAGRYLESWFPSNLTYDRFTFTMDLTVASPVEHTLLTNAQVIAAGPGTWDLTFPATFTSLSPMVIVVPTTDLMTETRPHTLEDGTTVTIELARHVDVPDSDPPIIDRIAVALDAGVASTGAWLHGDRAVVYIWPEETRSMEYDGATSTKEWAVEHELFHSWYGRGVRPALSNDSWFDEAWNTYSTDEQGAFKVEELPKATNDPVTLDNGDPFTRITPSESYDEGKDFFGHLAFLMGVTELQVAMADFYVEHAPDPVTTGQLEAHLYCRTGDPAVVDAFHRYVYGRRGEAELPECP